MFYRPWKPIPLMKVMFIIYKIKDLFSSHTKQDSCKFYAVWLPFFIFSALSRTSYILLLHASKKTCTVIFIARGFSYNSVKETSLVSDCRFNDLCVWDARSSDIVIAVVLRYCIFIYYSQMTPMVNIVKIRRLCYYYVQNLYKSKNIYKLGNYIC